jgi:DNA-binding NtrC family response regulator
MGREMEPSHSGARERPTVLVMDASGDIRELMRLALADTGVRVVVAESCAEALAVAAGIHVDLLIADVVLPDSDGLALAAMLRDMRPELRVIFVSAWFDHPMFPDLTGEVVLSKPFRLEEFRSAVENALPEWRSTRTSEKEEPT